MGRLTTMRDMNQYDTFSSMRLIDVLKQGYTLRFLDLPVLVRFENGKFLVSGPNFTLRLDQNGFLDTYGRYTAVVADFAQMIDEKKDEEYYAWRRENQ